MSMDRKGGQASIAMTIRDTASLAISLLLLGLIKVPG